MVIENSNGGFRFIRGSAAFCSSGVVAAPGFEIVRASFRPLAALAAGFDFIERHLVSVGRTASSMCGIELRIPKALSNDGFDEFNRGYLKRLKQWNVNVEGLNPITRTNVALEPSPVSQPSMLGFYYTVPAASAAQTFVLAGAAEIKSRGTGNPEIVAQGDLSTAGLRMKTECVMDELAGRLREMNVGWRDASAINLYTVHDAHTILVETLLPALGEAAGRGITWHHARPPVVGIELEIDGHAVNHEMIVSV